jgi:hypothetical protein
VIEVEVVALKGLECLLELILYCGCPAVEGGDRCTDE